MNICDNSVYKMWLRVVGVGARACAPPPGRGGSDQRRESCAPHPSSLVDAVCARRPPPSCVWCDRTVARGLCIAAFFPVIPVTTEKHDAILWIIISFQHNKPRYNTGDYFRAQQPKQAGCWNNASLAPSLGLFFHFLDYILYVCCATDER